MMIEMVRNDPEYNDGNYTQQPRSMKLSAIFYGIATAGGTLRYQDIAPTREKADQFVDARLAAPLGPMPMTGFGNGVRRRTTMPCRR